MLSGLERLGRVPCIQKEDYKIVVLGWIGLGWVDLSWGFFLLACLIPWWEWEVLYFGTDRSDLKSELPLHVGKDR